MGKFVSMALGDAKESEAVPEGEYDLRVIKVEDKTDEDNAFKSGRLGYGLLIAIESPDHPNAAPVSHNLMFPKEGDKDNTVNMMLLNTRRFLEVFNIAYEDNGFDADDLEGATGNCLLRQVPAQKETEQGSGKYVDIPGEFRNELVLPRLKSEEADKPARGGSEKKKGPSRRR